MLMKKRSIITVLLVFFLPLLLTAQEKTYKGVVVGIDGQPIQGAIITYSYGSLSVVTASDGSFSLDHPDKPGRLTVVAEGYYDRYYPLNETALPGSIVLTPTSTPVYTGTLQWPDYTLGRHQHSLSTQGVEKKDVKYGWTIDQSIQDKVTGLRVVRQGGMPGEGAYLNIRGLHSIVGANTPLYVVNGIPYFGHEDVSHVINGYSRSALFNQNTRDIRSVTVLKGADAAVYGSLGSNGVILIETEQATSDNLETRISFTGQYGLSLPGRSLPVLGTEDYKTYLQDIGMTRYSLITALQADYPFLQQGDNYHSYLFNNRTDWSGRVQGPSFVTDNVFRVEGGDEIAKYNISFGYLSEGGVLGSTKSDRYHTLINSNIMVSRAVDIFTNVGLYYVNSKLQEQGMQSATNPLLAAYHAMPLLSPYQKEPDGTLLNTYATYDGWNVNNNPTFPYDNVSNPLAIVNTVKAADIIYDANIRLGLNVRANRYLTLTGLLNLYYNYTQESIFIPGVTNKAIVPQYYGVGKNTVRKGITEDMTNFYGLSGLYQRTLGGVHRLMASTGLRFMNRSLEYDLASGYNTANDFYETLGNVTDDPDILGSNLEWKWLNYHLKVEDTWNEQFKGAFNLSVDGTSVSGLDAPRFGWFPALSLTWMAANAGLLPDAVSLLNFSAEVSRTGNSRFSSNFAKNYYQNANFFNLGTITRSNVPNTKLEWEKKDQIDLGIDLSLINNLVNIQVNAFAANAFDLLVARQISSVYGSSSYYDNVGAVETKGWEAVVRLNPVRTKTFDWVLGGSLSRASSLVTSLGNSQELATTYTSYNNDDAMTLLKVGEAPYQFYGYKTDGIYRNTDEVTASGLTSIYGSPYQAGDVRFVDKDGNGEINAKDKYLLGNATPTFYGGLFTVIRYKALTLDADIGYAVGNKAYNAVRRTLESMETFHNQSAAVLNRWQMEGQAASLPRAAYGDPSGNNLFSDRWIEDASYLKLRSLTLRYDFQRGFFNLFRSGAVYVVGENLFTLTKYLGSDPEFAYGYAESMQGFDYGKVSLPTSLKMGFTLNF